MRNDALDYYSNLIKENNPFQLSRETLGLSEVDDKERLDNLITFYKVFEKNGRTKIYFKLFILNDVIRRAWEVVFHLSDDYSYSHVVGLGAADSSNFASSKSPQ